MSETKLQVPEHVAIILDGNGRWAKKRLLPRKAGHVAGSQTVEQICEDAWNLGIKYLTVYAFSTENWKRPKDEVDALMKLLRRYLKDCIKRSTKNNMCVRVLGDITPLEEDLKQSILKLEEVSKNNTGLHFQVALNYGSRDERLRSRTDYRRIICITAGYERNSGSGSADPYQRGRTFIELSFMAAGVYRILLYGCALAGFQ